MQYTTDSEFKIQVTDESKFLDAVTTPPPAPAPSTYEGSELSLPFCGHDADFKDDKKKMIWKAHSPVKLFDFVDFANSVTLYRRVKVDATVWYDGKPIEVTGGIGLAEVYHV